MERKKDNKPARATKKLNNQHKYFSINNLLKLIIMKKITLLLFILMAMPSFSQSPALKFNGTDNAIDWADASPVLRTSGNHTWEMWVKGAATTVGVLYTEGWSGSNYRGQFRLNANGAGKLEIEFRNYAGTYLIANNSFSTTTIFDDIWHHIAVVGTTTAGITSTVLYVDGVQDLTNFGTYTRPTLWDTTDGGALNHSTIGQITRSSQWIIDPNYTWYNGEIDEFRAWTRALDVSEISANKCSPLNTTNLYRHVKFNEGTGTTFANTGSSANTGTLAGVTSASTYTTNSSCANLANKEFAKNAMNVSIATNRTTGIINISAPEASAAISVSVFDLTGKVVGSTRSNDNTANVSLSNVSSGVYLVKVTDGVSSYTQKIIKN
jgi:hypothetical protein